MSRFERIVLYVIILMLVPIRFGFGVIGNFISDIALNYCIVYFVLLGIERRLSPFSNNTVHDFLFLYVAFLGCFFVLYFLPDAIDLLKTEQLILAEGYMVEDRVGSSPDLWGMSYFYGMHIVELRYFAIKQLPSLFSTLVYMFFLRYIVESAKYIIIKTQSSFGFENISFSIVALYAMYSYIYSKSESSSGVFIGLKRQIEGEHFISVMLYSSFVIFGGSVCLILFTLTPIISFQRSKTGI